MKAYRKCLEQMLKRSVQLTAGLILMATIAVQAADVSEYGVLKGKKYTQTETGTPGEDYIYYWWSAYVRMSVADAVTNATAQPPGLSALPLLEQDNPTLLQLEIFGGLTMANMNETFPNGDYVVIMDTVNDGSQNSTLSLTGDSYPNTPTFLDVAALETVNPSEAFPLSWSAFTGGTANDFIQVRIVDDYGDEVFITPALGQEGALSGTSATVTLPADTLSPESFYTVTLTFTKVVTRNTSDYAGAIGVAGYYKSTDTSLQTTTSGTGGETTPPELVSSNPENGQYGVSVNSPVIFVFDKPMTNSQSIAWSANLSPAGFTYSWSGDGRTLTCTYQDSLPATAIITWNLNPSGQPLDFKDEAGNPLPEDTYSGAFITAADTNNPCQGDDTGRGSGGIIKELIYVQTSAADPVPDSANPASFFGMMTSPTNNPVTSALLQVPGGPLLTLTNFTGFGRGFMLIEDYASQSALDTARPNATYNLQLTRTTGAPPSTDISLSGTYPPTPKIQNYTACQSVDPSADFTVQWNGFSGAGTDDHVSLSIRHPATTWHWSAPDPCVPRDLANTATSVTIPAGTLQPGITYEASLVYMRMTYGVSNAIPDIDVAAYLHKTVNFSIRTTGGGNDAAFIGWNLLPSGNLELELQGTAGLLYTIETTDDLLAGWSNLTVQLIPAGGVATFEVATGGPQAYFRASPQ